MMSTALNPETAVPKYQDERSDVMGNSVRIDNVRLAVTVVSKPNRVRAKIASAAIVPRITPLTMGSLLPVSITPGGVHEINATVNIAAHRKAATRSLRTTTRKTNIRKSAIIALLMASFK